MSNRKIGIRYIETTGKCNLNCPICVDRFRNYDMDINEFIKIINVNKGILRDSWIWLDFNGEPLMDEFFFDRIKHLKELGVHILISTNGLLLTKNTCMKLISAEIDYVVISVMTLDRELYRQLRGIDALENVLNNVILLRDCVIQCKSPMHLQAVAIDTGNNDLDSFISHFHSLGIDAAVHQFTNRAQCSRKTYSVEHDKITRGVCQGLKQNLSILCNCDVVTCCIDLKGRNSLGNLRDYEYSIEKLLNNGKLDEIIKEQEQHIFRDACFKCTDWIYFQEKSREKYVRVYPV